MHILNGVSVLSDAGSGTIVSGVESIFAVLGAGAKFIVNDVFLELIVKEVLMNPEAAIVWVPTAIGVGIMLFKRFKNPMR